VTQPAQVMNSGRALRLGVAGLGRAFQLMAPGLVQNPKIQLVAAADPRPEARTRFAADFSACAYDTVEKLCTDDHVEAVYISTPHQFHAEHVTSAARNGKHVLVEKPMATHPSDTALMVAAQKKSGLVGAVQMQAVGRSSMLELRAAIQGGAIGRIKEVFLSSLWWRTDSYYGRIPWAGRMKIDGAWCVDGALYNQCVHYVNQMLTLVSPGELPCVAKVRDLRCAMYKFHEAPSLEAGDTAFITGTLDIADSPRLTAVGTTCSNCERHQIEVLGDQGRALWNGAGYVFRDGEAMLEFHDDQTDFDGNSRVFNSFAEAIRAHRRGDLVRPPLTSFEQIANVTSFINACYDACGWEIKKAPWSATRTLFSETIQQVRAQRALPAALKNPPAWA
jgi:predicted dehydrogenase